jgi:nucleotide-binding universal stress UspA family protein
MLGFKRLLIPTDYSPNALAATRYGLQLAAKLGVEVHVVHVIEGLDQAGSTRSAPLVHPAFAAEVGYSGQLVESSVKSSNAASAILEYSEEHDIDVIVIGKYGSRGADRLITYLGSSPHALGTTTERIVRSAPCAIVTVSQQSTVMPSEVKKILLPLDFSRQSAEAVRVGFDLGELFDASVEFMHVRTVGARAEQQSEVHDVNDVPVDPQEEGSGTVRFFTVQGRHVGREVIRRVRETDIGLLAIYSHGATRDKRARLSDTADSMLRFAPCSVLTVKSFGKSPVLRTEASDRDLVTRLEQTALRWAGEAETRC